MARRRFIQPKPYSKNPARKQVPCPKCGVPIAESHLHKHVDSAKCDAFRRARELEQEGYEMVSPETAQFFICIGYGNAHMEPTGVRTSPIDRETMEYYHTHEWWVERWVVSVARKYVDSFSRVGDEPALIKTLSAAAHDPLLQQAHNAERELLEAERDEVGWDGFELTKESM